MTSSEMTSFSMTSLDAQWPRFLNFYHSFVVEHKEINFTLMSVRGGSVEYHALLFM